MTETEKIRVLLPHWIEHNSSHEKEFKKWAEILKAAGSQETADLIDNAAASMSRAGKTLSLALETAGGPLKGGTGGADHHHHD